MEGSSKPSCSFWNKDEEDREPIENVRNTVKALNDSNVTNNSSTDDELINMYNFKRVTAMHRLQQSNRKLPSVNFIDSVEAFNGIDPFYEMNNNNESHIGFLEKSNEQVMNGGCLWFNNRYIEMCINWLPKMCSCLENVSLSNNYTSSCSRRYDRITSNISSYKFRELMQRARRNDIFDDTYIDNERNANIKFYNMDETYVSVTVEKNLRVIDLCELLKVKNQVTGPNWSVVESWTELGIERTLEDHDDILQVYKEKELFAPHTERKFYFLPDSTKHDFFFNPETYFPSEMIVASSPEDRNSFLCNCEDAIRAYLTRNDIELPKISSEALIFDPDLNRWITVTILLENRKLYISKTDSNIQPKQPLDNEQPISFAHLADYQIYKIPNAKKYFNAPFQWGACLRPSSNAEAEDTEAGVSGLKVIAFNSEKSRTCWLTAMRLAKLKDNYRAFKNKSEPTTDANSGKEQFRTYNVSNESFRSRVAMDFTGSVGRIVEDPMEARAIAESEGLLWKQTWRPPLSRLRSKCPEIDDGAHASKPWFHKAVNREKAAILVKAYRKMNGVFLVRESRSYPGAFVLTYKYSEKIFHAQIQRTRDEKGNGNIYTLDNGATKFFDLVQLVEFYKLNAGSLPTRLTLYVDNKSPVSSKSSSASTSVSSPSSIKQSRSPRKNDIDPKTSRS
ncbi:growth factor receptor-bound protein 14-like isoform X2 [Chelonus insularis]|uniref:growth factor receptor-bound protein 14-like isoform X2 n=1 Tax=Chelonus insularis TaxID=460826 RepID=UPI001588CD40|nr:growth factor receptor-bound protein 14-like isoform X2 [Chelonus insularis]